MLDHFSILTQGGLVLWSRSFAPGSPPFDSLVREALIEQRTTTTSTTSTSPPSSSSSDAVSRWDKDAHSLLWLLANDLDLIFCCAYQRILSLPYVADLLLAVRKAFLKAYGETVRALVASSSKGKDVLDMGAGKGTFALFGEKGWEKVWEGWEATFARIRREFESDAAKNQKSLRLVSTSLPTPDSPSTSSEATTPALDATPSDASDAQAIARNIAALKARQKAAQRSAGKGKGRSGADSEAGSESDGTPTKPRPPKKTATKWADSSYSEKDLAAYDYSSDAPSPSRSRAGTPALAEDDVEVDTAALVSKDALGTRSGENGFYEVADFAGGGGSDSFDEDDDEEEDAASSTPSSSSLLGSFFSRLSLSSSSSASSSKTLTASDLAPSLKAMQQHLMSKNVAREIAEQVVAAVGKSLEGKPVPPGGWFSTRSAAGRRAARQALEEALVRILTPKTSTDLLLDIQRKRSATGAAGKTPDPYSLTFVGVNGVGKSTNLSKVAFWLLQNRLRVLIAACDTFRSGAVEQLRVHVRNLGKLEEELGGKGAGQVELYERGYGKDAAGIAKDAIAYAKQNNFDVVLIDTAGRMQDNEPLMRALAKLIAVNQPDKIIFVGEALVGNEAVDQLTKFNRSLRDFSGSAGAKGAGGGGGKGGAGGGGGGQGEARGIDGMILTKFDTIDDKVGAALSMTYTTGQPIFFVGTGQTYSDLRTLRVGHIVGALMQE
ncbi:hypothetical protein JCM8547_000581 [Rhodosporidiobolus lusitaniae]